MPAFMTFETLLEWNPYFTVGLMIRARGRVQKGLQAADSTGIMYAWEIKTQQNAKRKSRSRRNRRLLSNLRFIARLSQASDQKSIAITAASPRIAATDITTRLSFALVVRSG